MNAAAVVGVLITIADEVAQYGPEFATSIRDLVEKIKNKGELTEEDAKQLRDDLHARSKRIQDA